MSADVDHAAAPSQEASNLASVLRRNIAVLRERREREQASASLQQRLADAITGFTGSMAFVYLHLAAVGFWIVANLGWLPGVAAWDPSFVVLAMIASVEAIFLSTFVLISQNRMSAAADRRAELDLQINLLSEHEITRLVELVAEIAGTMGVTAQRADEVREAQHDVAPEAVLDTIDSTA